MLGYLSQKIVNFGTLEGSEKSIKICERGKLGKTKLTAPKLWSNHHQPMNQVWCYCECFSLFEINLTTGPFLLELYIKIQNIFKFPDGKQVDIETKKSLMNTTILKQF